MGELQGREMGGYLLLDEIGGGGVAEVYHARQVAGGGADVVVKVIFKEFARQPGFARNLAYVTEAAARLSSHPHILPLVAHGEENEYIYLVTPYVKEGTLADWLAKGGRLGATDVGPFFQQLCGALSYAHSLGVVHGNIKPSNVFLHEGRHVLLGDFGLLWDVRALDASWSGSGVEAFEYLAPEVFGGEITQASDIYSLGATLFHALTGHPPFHMNRLGDLIAAARQQQQPSLAQQQPPLAPALTALDPVVAQAMAKRPEDRFASAVLVAQSIEGALRQAAAMGASITPPNGQPQWQPYASTPISAGAFNIAGNPPAPGQINAAPSLDGFMPLTQLETPFPPLPAAALVDEGMEQGGVALSGGLAFNPASSQLAEPPTMRIPAPPANPLAGEASQRGNPQLIGEQPATAPRMGGPTDSLARNELAALDTTALPPNGAPNGGAWNGSQRLPAVQPDSADGDFGAESGVYSESGTFSPTELGLPRLTNPEMAGLPQDWRDLLTDESAMRRHDPFAESQGALLPMYPPSSSDLSAAAFSQQDPGRRDERWDTADPGRQHGATPRGMNGAYDGQGEDMAFNTPRSRSRDDAYDGQRSGEPPRRQRRDEDDFAPSLAEQKVWTNRHTVATIANIGKRISATPFVFLALAALILVELAGFAVTRPDLCVTHACAVVAGEVQKYAPNLRIPGAPAPITFAPATLKISAATNSAEDLAVTLTNTGSRSVTWSASTTLGWLTVSPASGSLAQGAHTRLTLTARPSGVSPGAYLAGLVVDAATGESTVAVALTVTPGPALSVTPATLAFSACGAGQPLAISNTGGGKLNWSAAPSQSAALSVSPASGVVAAGAQANATVTLSCNAVAGQPYAVILVSNGGSAQTTVTYG